MNENPCLDIGFWFPRPDRGARLAEELRQLGHVVTIYHSRAIPGDQAFVRRVSYNMLGGLRQLKGLTHDVMYTSSSFLPVLQLRANKWRRGTPYVYVINGAVWAYYGDLASSSRIPGAKKALYPWLLRLSLSGADAIVANSSFLAEGLRAKFPSHAGRVSTIYNGIDYASINSGRGCPDAWPSGELRLLSVVTLNFLRKTDGVRLLIDTFNAILRCHPDAVYLIAAKAENPELVRLMRDYVDTLPCKDRVKIDMNRNDVPDLLAAADLFLYATPEDSSDSLPRVLLEAQAAGVPIATTDTTGCGEVVHDGKSGRLVGYDAGALACAANDLLRDRGHALKMAETGTGSVQRKFSWKAMADSYENLFMRVLGKRQGNPVGVGEP